jgi:very-short-patch-repair endonuclease
VSPVVSAAAVTRELVRRIPGRAPKRPRARQAESPVERMFREAWCELYPQYAGHLVAQYPVTAEGQRFRLDFGIPALTRSGRLGIEIDGHATHSSPAAIAHDRRRQRILERAGWRVIRFGGAEVRKDARGCVREAAAFAGIA